MSLFNQPAFKLGLIVGLLLLLQVPILMVMGQIEERQDRQRQVEAEFARGWGPPQLLWGPVVTVPYRYQVVRKEGDAPIWVRGFIQVAADHAQADIRLTPETRRRGMFEATVYTADVAMQGGFKVPQLRLPAETNVEPLWQEARLMFGVSNGRAMGADLAVTVDGAPIAVEPVEGAANACAVRYLAVPLQLDGPRAFGYATAFKLRGTRAIEVAPEAGRSAVSMQASWPSPSFLEGMMPSRYERVAGNFSANWEVGGSPGIATPIDFGASLPGCSHADSTAGVALLPAVPTYLMVSRTAKYETLFLVLAFLTYFLFETLSGIRIHPVQYGLLGLSVTLFPLLLVATAEPFGFGAGYAVATAAVLAQATLFTLSVTRRRGLTVAFGALLAGLFAYLYFVVRLESYALLAGTVALFVVLSSVMVATRRIHWSVAAAN